MEGKTPKGGGRFSVRLRPNPDHRRNGMFDHTFPTSEPHDDLPASDGIGAFCYSGKPRPDTSALLAGLGMPAHAIRSFIATQAGVGSDG